VKKLLAAVVALALGPLAGALVASASQLPVTPASITATMVATVAAPASLGLALTNGGSVAGQAENADRLVVTFPRALDASTLCSTWAAAPTTTQSISANGAVVVTIADGTTDGLSVTSPGACGGTFGLGTVDLGSPDFTAGGALTFSGNGSGGRTTVSYDPTTFQVTIVFGARAGAGTPGTVGSVTARFTPASTLKFSDGTTVAPGFASTTGVLL
jgi:hypothetical protein